MMLARPVLTFDLGKIKDNAVKIMDECRKRDITPCFATKGFCAAPEIVEAMLSVGYYHFCDSRILNIIKVKKIHPGIHMMLIRSPAPCEAEEVVTWADSSIQSDISTVRAVSAACVRLGKTHDIWINVDVGDIRDGLFYPEQLAEFTHAVKDLPGIHIIGVFSNVGCYGSVIPTEKNSGALADIRDALNERYGLHMKQVSFGGTVAFPMITEGRMPERVNHFRFAEAALFGEDTTGQRYLEGFHRDAVTFEAPVLECIKKPSVPVGELGRDSCGRANSYPDRGVRARVILAAGKQDVDINALTLLDDRMILIGSSSDHMIVDAEDAVPLPKPGDYVSFRCGYMAMLAAATSEYVEKRYL